MFLYNLIFPWKINDNCEKHLQLFDILKHIDILLWIQNEVNWHKYVVQTIVHQPIVFKAWYLAFLEWNLFHITLLRWILRYYLSIFLFLLIIWAFFYEKLWWLFHIHWKLVLLSYSSGENFKGRNKFSLSGNSFKLWPLWFGGLEFR